jgi:hypothetical protein
MKTKIFYTSDETGTRMETQMNEWFAENPNINIEKFEPLTNKYCFWIVIVYTEKPLV